MITRLIRRGHLIRLYRGVYAVGHTRLTPKGRWMAAVLACGEGAVLSHRTAAALWGLSPSGGGGPVDVTGPIRRRVPGVRFHRARTLDPRDRTIIDGIPVTSLGRTLLDMAGIVHRQRLRTILEAAQRLDAFDYRAVEGALSRANGRREPQALRAGLSELTDEAPWTQSVLEQRFLELIREAGLPEPQINVVVDGYVVDFHWREYSLIVELDGFRYHRSRRSFEEDRSRDAAHLVAGRQTLRVTQRRIQHERRALQDDLSALLSAAVRSGR